jgi:hypothetical protein
MEALLQPQALLAALGLLLILLAPALFMRVEAAV